MTTETSACLTTMWTSLGSGTPGRAGCQRWGIRTVWTCWEMCS